MSARRSVTAPAASDSHAPFDARSYWETRLQENPGLWGVGNTRMGGHSIQWWYKVRRAVFLLVFRSLGKNLETAEVVEGIGSLLGCRMRLNRIAVSHLRSAFPGVRVQPMDIGEA